MLSEYDIQLYGSVPADGLSAHSLGWAPPHRITQELWKGTLYTSKCGSVDSLGLPDVYPGNCSHAREHSAGHRFLAVVMRFFNKKYHVGRAHPVVMKKDTSEPAPEDLECASSKCEASGNPGEIPTDSDCSDTTPPTPDKEEDDSVEELEWPGSEKDLLGEDSLDVLGEGPETELNVRRRVISFADDAGLPLFKVNVYEAQESSDEDEETEDGATEEEAGVSTHKCPRLKGFHSPARAKRRRRMTKLNGKRAQTLTSPLCEVPATSYKRYYKPYVEDYAARNLQNTGALSMIGF